MSALEDRLAAVNRERKSATAGIGIAMLWLISDDQDHLVRSMARDKDLTADDFRAADEVERIHYAGWDIDDLIKALEI
jgi:hypothetical protein